MRDIIIVLFIILIPVFIIVNINYYNSDQTITAKVIDKERISQVVVRTYNTRTLSTRIRKFSAMRT